MLGKLNIAQIFGVAITMIATPAYASSAALECRDNQKALGQIKSNIDAFNMSQDLWREAHKKLFQSSVIDHMKWSHVFGEEAYETHDEIGQITLQWFYHGNKLSFSQSNIVKDGMACGWVRGEDYTDIFEIKTSPDNKILSINVTTDK